MQKLELQVTNEQGKEIIIREGQALPLKAPERVILHGDIKSVSGFLKARNVAAVGSQVIDAGKVVVQVDKMGGTIVLQLDPENAYGATVTGQLEFSDELQKWFVNQSKTWKQNELVKHLRFNRIDFDDYEKHDQLLKSYQQFSFKSYIEAQAEQDQRGNKSTSLTKKVETGLPVDFVLNIPIFKGFDSQRFHVEICLETTEGSANFWFESVELNELIKTQKDIIFNEELKHCAGFVIINK